MMWLFKDANYPFLRFKNWGYAISIGLTLLAVAVVVVRGGLKYSIDFTGGTLMQLEFDEPVESQALREALADMEELKSSEVQRFGDINDFVIRAQVPPGQENAFRDRIEAQLRGAPQLEGKNFRVVRAEAVGPKIGDELKGQALRAILYAMALIMIYVAFRFDFKFGLAAIIATFHDIVMSVGIFALVGKEISLAVVAAFLTIVGYSLNDTIVVFDRIRENLRSMRRESYAEVVNTSVNQTLSRTIITGGATLIVLLFLFFMGGSVIHDFAFALLIGILIGTYSSIFIAAPLVLEWHRRFEEGRAPATGARKTKVGARR
ncbi:MAG TPA: protein translocase subunit SecF [Gemmatimonadota bacterium]|jgi:preprotein translocase SecF subunit|nr:protein translocase subunit SecF [Gemmatimonadota bacterium]